MHLQEQTLQGHQPGKAQLCEDQRMPETSGPSGFRHRTVTDHMALVSSTEPSPARWGARTLSLNIGETVEGALHDTVHPRYLPQTLGIPAPQTQQPALGLNEQPHPGSSLGEAAS